MSSETSFMLLCTGIFMIRPYWNIPKNTPYAQIAKPSIRIKRPLRLKNNGTVERSGTFRSASPAKAWDALKKIPAYITANLHPALHNRCEGVAFIGEWVFVGEGTVIEDGAMIKGPAIIGRNCEIRHNAYIRDNVIIGDIVQEAALERAAYISPVPGGVGPLTVTMLLRNTIQAAQRQS